MADRNLELALRIRAAVEGSETVEDLRQRLGGLADEIEGAANPTDEFNRGLRETEDAGRRAGAGVDEASGKFGELTDVVKGFLGLALAKEILDLNDRLTTLKRGFEVVTGSSEATDRALSFVRETADRLGVSALDLSDSFLKITAAAKGTQLEGAATEKIFSSIAGAMATVGGSGEDLERVMDAVGQMMGKGVISAEELRGQLGDSLPGAVNQASQALMVSNAELAKMLESGEIVASEFLPKFAAQLEQSMGGGGKKVETFAAAWNRLMNQFADFGTGDVGAAATKVVVFLTDALGGLVRGAGFASDMVGALGRALGGIAAGNFGEAFSDLGQDVSDATLHMMGLKTESEAAAERQRQIAEELRNLTPEMDRFQDAVGRGDLKELPESLQGAISELRKTGDVAAATEQAITNFMSAPAKNLDLTGVLKLATSLQAVGKEAAGAGTEVSASLGAALSKLTNEQLKQLEEQARKAMAAAGDDQNARKVFADLGQVIESVVLARLERLGVDGPEALTGISLAAQDAMDDFDALANNADLSANTIEKAFDGALAKLDSPEELEKFKQKIIELGKDGTLTGEQVERALLLIRQRSQEVANDPAFGALAEQLAKVREETERETEAGDRAAKTKEVQIEAAIKLAQAKGDEAEAARLSAEAAQQEVDRSRERIQQLGQQIIQIDQHIQKLYAQANADGQYSDAEREVIEALKEKSAKLAEDRAQIEAHLPMMEREAQQAAIMAGPIGQLARLYADQAKEHGRAADASERYYSVQLKEIEGATRVAQAKGDENAVMALQVKQQKILIEQAEALAAAKATEAEDAQKALEAKKLELAADGELSKADQEQIANLQAVVSQKQAAAKEAKLHATALQKEADALKQVNDGASAFDNAAQNAYKFSDAAEDVARRNAEVSATAENAKNAMEGVNAAMAKFGDRAVVAFGEDSIKAFESVIRDIENAINDAGIAAKDLAENGLGGNVVHAEHLAEELEASESYLNQAAHGAAQALRQALASAREEAEAMVQSLAEAADATEKEILRLQGKNKEVYELEHAEKLRQLEEEYKKAGELGQAEYQRARAAEEELHKIKLQQLKEQSETASRTGTTTTTTTSGGGGSGSGSSGRISSTISPVFNFPNAITVDRQAVEDLTRKHILPVLKDIERRTR